MSMMREDLERDLTVPCWIDLFCPGCGETDGKINANAVNCAADPDYKHACGYRGPFEWINPNPPAAVWAERFQKGHPLPEPRKLDNWSSTQAVVHGSL
jgi:hypothetical protein